MAFLLEAVMKEMVTPETIIALALLKARATGTSIRIEDVSALFGEARKRGLELEKVALRRVPGGLYSEDVEAFAGRLFAAGYAKARSPITLEEKGVRICEEIVGEELRRNPESLRTVASVLDLDGILATVPTPV
ncbi:MAG: hypothetical protein WBE37_05380 [Bryobacteraceae bacterium]